MNYRISRNLEYALMALSYMSERKNLCISAKEMVQVFQCPFHPFSRVLQKMADQDFIRAKKGIGGGYILSKNLSRLSLYTLMRGVLPPLEIAACLTGHCNLLEHCNIQSPVHYLNKRFLEFYRTLKVQDILNCGYTQPPGKNFGHKTRRSKNMKETHRVIFDR